MTWRFRGHTPSPEEFPGLLWSGVLTQFAVAPRDHPGAICGLVQGFNHDPGNRFAYLGVVVDPMEQRRTTAAAEGIVLLLAHLFDAFDLRKINIETTEVATAGILRMAETWPMVSVEGVLRDSHFHAGHFVDLYILAVDRESFNAHRDQVFRLVSSSGGPSARLVNFDQFVASIPHHLAPGLDGPQASPSGGTLLAADLGVDSLGLVEVIAWVEDTYDVAIPDASFGELTTLQDLFAAYEGAVQASNVPSQAD